MVSELDSRITSQLALHRGLHTLAGPLLAILRDLLLKAKLQDEINEQPFNRDLATALEGLDRWSELAEKVDMERTAW